MITGGNGAIGYEVLLHTLRAGYTVRAVVRTQAKADLILNAPSVQALDAETRKRLSFALVPDLLDPKAYDEALQDVLYVIHVASPIPKGKSNDLEVDLVQPAITGTMNMLKAAEKASVKRVVVTSSVVGQITFEVYAADNIPGTYDEKTRTPNVSGPYANEGAAYVASKTLALNAAEEWKRAEQRRIELVHVHPSLVLGRMELAQNLEEVLSGSSTGRALAQILEKEGLAPPVISSNTCSIDDVAEVHARALNSNVPDGQSLVVVGNTPDGSVWESGKDVIAKAFPEAVKKGKFSDKEWSKTKVWRYDVSETERLVGMKFTGFEKQIEEIGRWYLERGW